MSFTKRDIPSKAADVSEWYLKVVAGAKLADYGPVKGTMIIQPWGYALWERLQADLDARIKARGVENAYFPLFIPESLLKKEASHVEGFSPELAVVTIAGGEELGEKLVVRPTSETIMYQAYADWIQSWRDLPVLINQWNNVVRWEKRTYPFLRTSEFLWQEGHTAHATHEEAWDMVLWGINTYQDVYRELFAIPGYVGRKSEYEKFAGADATLTYEMLMPGGKALQGCTSHDLGQNFSKAFDITYMSKEEKAEPVWQTSWGFTTRSIGALIMTHGDDNGLRLPPRIAPIQVVVVPIRETENEEAGKIVDELKAAGVRAHLDDRDYESLGSKINHWELKGVPLRIEVGARELADGVVTLAHRYQGQKGQMRRDEIMHRIPDVLEETQLVMLHEAEAFLEENTRDADSYDDFKAILSDSRGFIRAFWCEDRDCEAAIKEETKATTRCLPLNATEEQGSCIRCGNPATHRWFFAIAY